MDLSEIPVGSRQDSHDDDNMDSHEEGPETRQEWEAKARRNLSKRSGATDSASVIEEMLRLIS